MDETGTTIVGVILYTHFSHTHIHTHNHRMGYPGNFNILGKKV